MVRTGRNGALPDPASVGSNARLSTEDSAEELDAAEEIALAELAEAEAAEAKARTAVARARARAVQLRRQAAESSATKPSTPNCADPDTTVITSELGDDETIGADSADDPTDTAEESAPRLARVRGWFRGLRPRALLTAVAVALVCALVGLSTWMLLQHRDAVREQRRAAEFAAAARQSVVSLMSIDFNKAKEDVQRIVDNSTGQFKSDFGARADDMVKVAQDAKVVTTATVSASAVQSMTNDSAVVLVAATSQVTNSAGAKKEPRTFRLSVTVAREGGQIKLSRVEFIP